MRTGVSEAVVYRWFTDPESRRVYPKDDHPLHAVFVADLRVASARPAHILERSPEFAGIWNGHAVGIARTGKPGIGLIHDTRRHLVPGVARELTPGST